MSFHCFSRVTTNVPVPRFRRTTPLLILIGLCLLAAPRPSRAADIYSGFAIDLNEVGQLYDNLYRDRVTQEVVDSTIAFDWDHIQFGNQRYRVTNFLTTDYSQTRTVTDYTVIPGYRVRFTVPRTSFFESTLEDVGDLTITRARNYDTPGLQIELTPVDSVVADIVRESREYVWRDVVRQNILTAPTPGESTAGGIKFDIPLPMPKTLESIFGPGEKTSITVRGREEITIAGETRVTKPFIGVEGRQNQSLFPSLDMQQRLDVNLTGTIGDKVSIQVDHSSEAIGDDANRVRLAYQGYEDEVIQLIELGNTSLSLPGSQLVSVSTGAQGLFGIKMLAQMGSTDFTLIASKQEGEVSSATFSPTGGTLGQAEEVPIRDVDYIKNKYFYFDDPRDGFVGPDQKRLESIEVFRTVTQLDLNQDPSIQRLPGWVMPDSLGDGSAIGAAVTALNSGGVPSRALKQDFQLLQAGTDFEFITDSANLAVIGIELFDAVLPSAQKAIGVSYINQNGVRVGGSYATLGVNDPATGQPPTPNTAGDLLMLKMLKAPDPRPQGPYGSTWRLMIRNIYNMGLTNIDGNSLVVQIEDNLNTTRLNATTPDSSDVNYLRIFGLDQTDKAGTGPPDDQIDLTYGFVDLVRGILQFPSLEPFAPPPTSVDEWTDGEFAFTGPYATQYGKSQQIYNSLLNATQELDVHQYIIKVRAVSTSKTFSINAFNIVENSETITIGAERLNRGTDYEIDYETGVVTLKEGALSKLTPNTNVSIKYEFKPLGGLGSSTLAGVSSVSKLGNNARLGTIFLYESRASSDNRPRLGEEPTRGFVGGITGSYEHQSRLLTDLANLLPYVDSDQPSTINIDGEIAASIPNPNTKNEAYIEDFEGTTDSDRISLSRRGWYWASLPIDSTGATKPADSRLKFIWYNIDASRGVHRRDLNPELDNKENTLVQSLDIDIDKSVPDSLANSYAGVMLGFPSGGLDISTGQFLEIWVNDFKNGLPHEGQLHIDLGIIDENFWDPGNNNPATNFNDEDKNRDGFAAAFDDTGLDGLFDEEEPGYTSSNPDPNGDDLDLSRDIALRYPKANGTEKNIQYDTEDLDRNGVMTRDNAYFSYVIDLSAPAEIDIREQYPNYDGFKDPGHENDTWRLYRVKLTNNTVIAEGGLEPRLDEIRHARIWFDGANDVLRKDGVGKNRLQITEFSIQGNRWEVDGIRDLSENVDSMSVAEFAIGAISTKTDPGVYHPPVVPNQKNEVSDKESSLAVRYQNLGDQEQLRVLRRYLGQGIDMTLYRDLNFWVHTDSLRTGVEYYFRLGSNEQNYYEIAVPFTGEYYNETGWARVVVNMSDITGLKFGTPVTTPEGTYVSGTAIDAADPNRVYPIRMQGAPSLQSVRFLYAGVRNLSNPFPQSGEIWMDDIFCGDVYKDVDHAERVSANVSLAGGAFSFGGNWARTGPDYRGLRQKRGSGSKLTVLSLNARTDLQYLMPLAGFSIPMQVNYTHNRSLPKFPPNSDTEITDPYLADSLRTEQRTRGFSTSLSRRNTSKNVWMRYTFDSLRPNFSYSDSRAVSPASRDTINTMAGSVSYTLNWTAGKTMPLFGKNRMRWWLNSLDFSSTATRTSGRTWSYRNGVFRRNPDLYSASLRNQGSVRYNPFRSLESTFTMGVNRDAAIPHYWYGVDVGTEVGRNNSLRLSFVPPRGWYGVSIFEPSIEIQSSYNEDSSPNVRRPGDPDGTRNASSSRNDSARLRFDIGKHFGNLFKLFGVEVAKLPTTGTPPRSPAGTAPSDSTRGAPADSAKAQPKPGAGYALRTFVRILTGLKPLSTNIQHRVNSSYLRIPERPDLAYRLGFDTNSGIEGVGDPDQQRENLSFNLDTGVQVTETFGVQGRYTRATTDTYYRTNQSRTLAVTWPDVQAKWDGLGGFKPLRPILTAGNLNVNYRETHQESGPRDQDPVTKNDTFSLSPAVDMTWKNLLQSTLSVSYASTTNDTKGSGSKTNSSGISLDLKRDFRGGGGFGFFGKKMSWDNNLETNLSIAYTRAGGERQVLGGVSEPIPSSTAFRIFPQVRYTFSRNINGSAFIDYSRSFTEATEQTTTVVRVGVTAVVTF